MESNRNIRALSGRIPELDGLRGTAIFFVLVYHYMEQQGNVATGGVTPYFQRAVLMGWSGVDLFFVLSGFLIGGILLDARGSSSYFRTFYIRRFFRIIPLYYLWIIAYLILISVAGAALRARSNSGIAMASGSSVYFHFLFLQNLTVASFTGLAGAWFSHLWSLAVEEQFYLLSPLVVRVLSKRHLTMFLAAVILGSPLLRIFLLRVAHTDPWLVSVLMFCRADSLAVGMLAAVLWRTDEFRAWISVSAGWLYSAFAVLLAGTLALWKWFPNSITWGMESVGFTWLALFYVVVLVLAIARPGDVIARLMRMNWLRELGRVSYCMYIIHLVVNVILHSLLRRASPATSDWSGTAVTILAAFTTYGIAWLSWKCFEGPLLHVGHAFKYQLVHDVAPGPELDQVRLG